MGGLGKITDSIVSKAELEAAEIIKKAQAEAEEIIKSAKAEVEKKRKTAEERINGAVEKIMLMGQGNDRQEERQIMLASKSKTILAITEEAKKRMKNMKRQEYKKALLKLIKMYSEGKEGEIFFSKKDIDTVDGEIKELLEKEKLKISGEPCSFENGFIIKYGKTEINCSIDSLFEEKYSELTDLVNLCLKE